MINIPTNGGNKYKLQITKISENVQEMLHGSINFDEVWNLVMAQVIDKIKKKEIKEIGQGTEGIVYKVKVKLPGQKDKILLAIKKRFDNELKNEVNIQNQFYDVAKNSKYDIKVPQVIGETNVAGDNYLLMEFIDGKTLFTLKMEKIAEEIYIEFGEKYAKFFDAIPSINKDIQEDNINKSKFFDFKTDAIARKQIHKIISFLNDQSEFFMAKYTGTIYPVILDKKTFDDIIEKIYYDDELDTTIFSRKEGTDIQDRIKQFLYEAHKKGLFHRDLGGNPTNIMFEQKGDKIIPVIIDFGKSKTIETMDAKQEYKKGEGPYKELGWNGDQDGAIPDTNICSIIKGLTEKWA